jgi:hypothetical protein
MNWTAIAKDGIAKVGYEEGSEILDIEFVSGKIFEFYNVSAENFDLFMKAPHKDTYYEINIARCPYRRLE